MIAPALPTPAQALPFHARFCGTPGGMPPPKSPDCPSPCHATCPRKHGSCDDDDPYTG